MSEKILPLEPGFARCNCQHCRGLIDFPVASFKFGQTSICPLCQQVTVLKMQTEAKETAAREEIIKELADKRAITTPPAGPVLIETKLERIGSGIHGGAFLLAFIMAVGSFLCFVDQTNPSPEVTPAEGIALALIAVGTYAQGYVIEALLRALAEIIRLLRAAKPVTPTPAAP